MEPKTLGVADYIVLAATLTVSASIGVFFRLTGGRQKTNKKYLLGDQDQGMLPVAFSLMASFMSSTSLLGVSAEVYMYSTLLLIQEYLLGDQDQGMLPVAFSLLASFMSSISLLGVSAEVYMYSTLLLIQEYLLGDQDQGMLPVAFSLMASFTSSISLLGVSAEVYMYSTLLLIQEYLLGDQDQGMLPVAFSLLASFMSSISLLGVSAEVYMYSTLLLIQEYLLGDQDQSMLPVAFSLMASFMSSISLLGVSAEVYMYSTLFFLINFAYLLWTPVAAYLYLPVFYKLQATSAYEYLYLRFGAKARTCASLMYSLQMVLYMGIVVYAPAIALEALTGLSQNISIVLVGAVCMFYCTLGGMKAVIWTDVFQSLLMFAAVGSVIFTAALQKGGLGPIWRIAEEGGRIQFFNINPDPTVRHTYFTLLIGGGFTFLSLYAVNQTQVQRYMTMKDYKTAVRSLWISTPILILLSGCTAFSGLAIYSKYHNCDPVLAGRISSRDQLMPLFVVETMGDITGLSGLFVAGIFSAALSTVSACLNSLAAVTLEDYIKPLYRFWTGREVPMAYSTQVSKVLALTYGVICIAVAFLSRLLGGVLQASLSIFGMVGGPLLAIFTLGMFFPCSNEPGAVVGLLAGLVSALLIGFGGPKPPLHTLPLSTDGCSTNLTIYAETPMMPATAPPAHQPTEYFYLYRVSYLYYIVMSFAVTVVVGLLVSCLTSACGRPPGELNPDLFVPPVANFLRRKKIKREMELNRDEKTEAEYTFSVHL